ncbi:uncharacterized protein LOC126749036 isoform X2 [Anthonomus grandis grandis]|uniref:uncharacterized protein LOC126749036 isoform X2 n=1 Tax=Anthonomus grandis grandis TaxID=2921223 RepID=UPI0021656BCB|nr:uncharacterized protein LOC126749036 isoform X2 [Anthonomus grandis grandis]
MQTCVLVFPSLSPNYLRVVRYQAKLCDLAVIPLGSGSSKSIGVCQKKYFLPPVPDANIEPSCPKQMADTSVPKKKRPPIQLYVPPAQRRSKLVAPQRENLKNDKIQKCSSNGRKVEIQDSNELQVNREDSLQDIEPVIAEEKEYVETPQVHCYCTQDIDYISNKKDLYVRPFYSYQCRCIKMLLLKDLFPFAKLLIFSINRLKHCFHWLRCDAQLYNANEDLSNFENVTEEIKYCNKFKIIFPTTRLSIFPYEIKEFCNINNFTELTTILQNRYCLCGDKLFLYLMDYIYCDYLWGPLVDNFKEGIQQRENSENFQDQTFGNFQLKYVDRLGNSTVFPQKPCENVNIDNLLEIIATSNQNESKKFDEVFSEASDKKDVNKATTEKKLVPKQIDRVIVLGERIEPPKLSPQSSPTIKLKPKQNEHEQEKEIMRKAKQNINRKTRPIIKYIDDDNDTLNIGKGDNVNNWEDLFNDEGELQEDIFTEIVYKVGPQVTIMKAAEDYSAYASKQVEELEHMVELYDFPPSFETNDIISSFSHLNSDSMYIKWIDDTHALLVLGSLTQAKKALEVSSPLIKVRPMSAASSLALEKANQFDLKPAMKRPQTNLQTARRLITSHLGAKSKVSREQSAKEREDLRLAKELKKRAKQNEKDAWEGSLRSSLK